jgi:hypothetical protein
MAEDLPNRTRPVYFTASESIGRDMDFLLSRSTSRNDYGFSLGAAGEGLLTVENQTTQWRLLCGDQYSTLQPLEWLHKEEGRATAKREDQR